ncbi:hypothetical protein DITRI_Ditri06bG0148200 [Diplodiscus trichospermus]
MDPKLYEAVVNGNIASLRELASSDATVLLQVTAQEDNILHVAAKYDRKQMAEEIIKMPRLASLVNQKNSKGDTPLHIAARLGSFTTAQILIDCANSMNGEIEAGERLVRMVNVEKDTALHDAARNVDKNHVKIAEIILEVAPVFSWEGRNKMNALHAAVVRSNEDFVAHLTEKCQSALSETDGNEWTPLHYAIHFDARDIFKQFLRYIDPSIAYIRDKEGMSVLHLAAREGETIMLEVLAYVFPEIWDLQDNKGQTVLHLAVATGNLDSIRFILSTDLSHDGLINQRDNEGNTALHLAAIQGNHAKIFDLLIKDDRVDKTATNMEGLSVVDILLVKEYGFYEKNWILMRAASNGGMQSLEHAINKNGRKTRSIETRNINQPQQSERREPASDTEVEGQRQPAISKAESVGLKKPSYAQLQNISSINLLVTTLIATVSFAAGFTMPGGYKSDGPDEGMAILSRKTAFRAFVISNALAFCFSSTSMFLHYCKSFVEKLDVLAFYTYITASLTSYGITAMVIAFVSGTYAALADSPGLAKAVLAIGCSFFGLPSIVYLK